MITIKDESSDKLIYWLDMARHLIPALIQSDRAEIDSLIAEVENADPVPIWFVMRTGNAPGISPNREEILGAFSSMELAEKRCAQIGDAVVGPLYIDEKLSDEPESWHGYYPNWPNGDGLRFKYTQFLKERYPELAHFMKPLDACADPVPNKDLIQAVYDADCATNPTLRGGMSDALSDALGRLYRAAGLVEEGA